MNRADIYVVAARRPARQCAPNEAALLGAWLDSGKGRQVLSLGRWHTRRGRLNAAHSAAYDQVYLDALDIDYKALARR